jgi:quinol monooxygenase YgiN
MPSPSATQTQDARVFTVTYLEVAPASTKPAMTAIGQFAAMVQKADGNLRVEIFQRIAPENQFVIVASWRDQPALEASRDAAASRQFLDRMAPHLISGIDNRVHSGMAVNGSDTRPATGSFCVVTHVDVPPPSKDTCIDLLKVLVEHSRKDPGVMRFEVFQQSDRPNHFSVVEVWRGKEDYLAHIVADHTKTFRKQLSPISGALYDERLYEFMQP